MLQCVAERCSVVQTVAETNANLIGQNQVRSHTSSLDPHRVAVCVCMCVCVHVCEGTGRVFTSIDGCT